MYKVTSQHIRDGKHSCPRSCPLALSLKENFDWNVEVTASTVKKYTGFSILGYGSFYSLSDKIRQWIYHFDTEEEVKPFEFEIVKGDGYFIKMKDEILENNFFIKIKRETLENVSSN